MYAKRTYWTASITSPNRYDNVVTTMANTMVGRKIAMVAHLQGPRGQALRRYHVPANRVRMVVFGDRDRLVDANGGGLVDGLSYAHQPDHRRHLDGS